MDEQRVGAVGKFARKFCIKEGLTGINDIIMYSLSVHLDPHVAEDVLDLPPESEEDEAGEDGDEGGEGEEGQGDLGGQDQEAANNQAEDTNEIDSQPGDEEIGEVFLDAKNDQDVTNDTDDHSEHLVQPNGQWTLGD